MRIVVAVDLNHQPELILDNAILWGARLGGTIDLMYSTTRPGLATRGFNAAMQEQGRASVASDETELQQLLLRIPEGHRGEAHLVEGRPIDVIPAKGREYDLIMVGTHARDEWRHLLLGSVAERIIRGSTKPVFVVRGPPPAGRFPVLCPVDIRDPIVAVLVNDAVVPWVKHFGTADLAYVDSDSKAEGLVSADAARLGELQAELPEDVRGKSWFETGEVAETLVAASISHPLAVLVTHGRTGMDRWWLGSVAERFVRLAPCSVLVLRRPQ